MNPKAGDEKGENSDENDDDEDPDDISKLTEMTEASVESREGMDLKRKLMDGTPPEKSVAQRSREDAPLGTPGFFM